MNFQPPTKKFDFCHKNSLKTPHPHWFLPKVPLYLAFSRHAYDEYILFLLKVRLHVRSLQFRVSNCLSWLKDLGSLEIFTRDNGRPPLIFIEKSPKRLKNNQFCLQIVPWYFLNFTILRVRHPTHHGIRYFQKVPGPPGWTDKTHIYTIQTTWKIEEVSKSFIINLVSISMTYLKVKKVVSNQILLKHHLLLKMFSDFFYFD